MQALPKVKAIRQQLMDVIGDKHQASMAKFGAILALGIIDAGTARLYIWNLTPTGGRNQTISLSSASGHVNLSTVAGLVIFLQYWYWYPFLNFISLSLSPTAVIGVNKNLAMPNYKMKSNARPSLYSVPAQVKAPKEVVLKALPTAQLSITKRQMLRESKRKREQGMDVEKGNLFSFIRRLQWLDNEMETEEKIDEKEEKEEEVKETKPSEPETTFELLNNPARVTRGQVSVISYDVDPRYTPVIGVGWTS